MILVRVREKDRLDRPAADGREQRGAMRRIVGTGVEDRRRARWPMMKLLVPVKVKGPALAAVSRTTPGSSSTGSPGTGREVGVEGEGGGVSAIAPERVKD